MNKETERHYRKHKKNKRISATPPLLFAIFIALYTMVYCYYLYIKKEHYGIFGWILLGSAYAFLKLENLRPNCNKKEKAEDAEMKPGNEPVQQDDFNDKMRLNDRLRSLYITNILLLIIFALLTIKGQNSKGIWCHSPFADLKYMVQPEPNSPKNYMIEYIGDGIYKGEAKPTWLISHLIVDIYVPHGYGEIQWPDGEKYIGLWEDGVKKDGIYFYDDGEFYDGTYVEGKRDEGVLMIHNGRCLVGKFEKGRFRRGMHYWPSGNRRETEHVLENDTWNDIKEFPREDVYVGRFKEGHHTGLGVFYYGKGGYYKGYFKNGFFHGEGELHDAENNLIHKSKSWNMVAPAEAWEKYLAALTPTTQAGGGTQAEVPTTHDKKSGKLKQDASLTQQESERGKHTQSARTGDSDSKHVKGKAKVTPAEAWEKYVATLSSTTQAVGGAQAEVSVTFDKKSGKLIQDVFHIKQGSKRGKITQLVRTGKFDTKRVEGKAKATFENGDVYEGTWKAGRFHGQGVMTYANGERYDGEWKDGLREGIGYYVRNKKEYVYGTFVKGQIHGLAVHSLNGRIIYNGRWENGRSLPSKNQRK